VGRKSPIYVQSSATRAAESSLPPGYRHGHAELKAQLRTTNLATKAVIPTGCVFFEYPPNQLPNGVLLSKVWIPIYSLDE
jgi:hypothetical protein